MNIILILKFPKYLKIRKLFFSLGQTEIGIRPDLAWGLYVEQLLVYWQYYFFKG